MAQPNSGMQGKVVGLLAVLVIVIGIPLLVLGCGSTAAPVAHTKGVAVMVAVPVNGATVAIGNIEVVGDVVPQGAVVRVAGHHVRVRAGAFTQRMRLHAGTNRIRVLAAAPGYGQERTELTVRYHVPRAGRRRPTSFTAQVNDVCISGDRGLIVMSGMPNVTSSLSEMRRLIAIQQGVLSRLQTIKPPPALQTRYAAFVTSLQLLVSENVQARHAVQTHSVSTLRRLAADAIPSGAFNSLARELGFSSCIQSVVPVG